MRDRPARRGDAEPAAQHPAVDLDDHAVLLGDGEETAGRDDLAARIDHAQQQLVMGDRARLQVHDRLAVEDEAVLVEGAADLVEHGQLGDLLVQAALLGELLGDVAEDDDRAAAGRPRRAAAPDT